MKKTYIYLALGAAAAWWFIKRKKAQQETTVEERKLVLLELGTKVGDLTPYRLTYSDNTTETGGAEAKKVQVLMQYAKQNGAEIRTGVEGIMVKLDGGTVVVRPKR